MLLKLGLYQSIALTLNPMAAVDPQSLYTLATCYQCGGTVGQAQLLKLGLLATILQAKAPGQATDPQTLMNVASVNCYEAGSNASQGDLYELALLNLIANNT